MEVEVVGGRLAEHSIRDASALPTDAVEEVSPYCLLLNYVLPEVFLQPTRVRQDGEISLQGVKVATVSSNDPIVRDMMYGCYVRVAFLLRDSEVAAVKSEKIQRAGNI